MANLTARIAEYKAALTRLRSGGGAPTNIVIKVVMPEMPTDPQGNLKVNTGWRPYGGG